MTYCKNGSLWCWALKCTEKILLLDYFSQPLIVSRSVHTLLCLQTRLPLLYGIYNLAVLHFQPKIPVISNYCIKISSSFSFLCTLFEYRVEQSLSQCSDGPHHFLKERTSIKQKLKQVSSSPSNHPRIPTDSITRLNM